MCGFVHPPLDTVFMRQSGCLFCKIPVRGQKRFAWSFVLVPGFLCGNMVLDKDGVSTAGIVAEMAAYLHTKNLSLSQQLHNIYEMWSATFLLFYLYCVYYYLCIYYDDWPSWFQWMHLFLHFLFIRYGYHISRTSYVMCNDPPTINKIFSRLRNFEGQGVYPGLCGGYCITHIRDVTTGYDSSRPDKKCVGPFISCVFG